MKDLDERSRLKSFTIPSSRPWIQQNSIVEKSTFFFEFAKGLVISSVRGSLKLPARGFLKRIHQCRVFNLNMRKVTRKGMTR